MKKIVCGEDRGNIEVWKGWSRRIACNDVQFDYFWTGLAGGIGADRCVKVPGLSGVTPRNGQSLTI